MQNQYPVIINSRKFDGMIHRSWKASLIERSDSLMILVGEFEQEVKHPKLGIIRRGTVSYEYYWLDRWYNIFRFHEPEGELRNFYCNINMPPQFENNILDYVDLEIDVLVSRDFNVEILDRDEFDATAETFAFSDELRAKTFSTLNELLGMIGKRDFPFNSAAAPS